MADRRYPKRNGLYRSRKGMLFGVCRTLAEKFNLEPWLVRVAQRAYSPILDIALRWRKSTLVGAAVLVVLASGVALRMVSMTARPTRWCGPTSRWTRPARSPCQR